MTPLDVLYIALAVSVFFVAVFVCWTLYETATFIRRGNKMAEELMEKFTRLEAAMYAIKDKLEHSATYLGLLAEGGKALISMFLKSRKEKSNGKRKRKSDLFDNEGEEDEEEEE